MSRNQPKLKPPARPFFSCGIFRNCTQSVLSPRTPPNSTASILQQTLPSPPPAAPPPPPPPPPATAPPAVAVPSSSSSSSSSSASHSFTQWRFPLQHSHHYHAPPPPPEPDPHRSPSEDFPSTISIDLAEAYKASELHFAAGDTLHALRLLERSLATASPSPPAVMAGVVAALRETETARAAAKVLLSMVLAEGNRRAAVEAGAAAAALEAVASAGAAATAVKERALAALELLCTVEEGAGEVREHALAPAALAGAVEGMTGRGRECGIGILAAIYGGERAAEAPAVVAHAVVVALQGECSARGRRKAAQLLRALKERSRLDLADVGDDC